jgi:hypothetical protein
MGYSAAFWTTTEFDMNETWYRFIPLAEEHIQRYYNYFGGGNSIRCVKDD